MILSKFDFSYIKTRFSRIIKRLYGFLYNRICYIIVLGLFGLLEFSKNPFFNERIFVNKINYDQNPKILLKIEIMSE